jgi:two-component system C4-dicarboxylate transport sensor histidine kinase DctB
MVPLFVNQRYAEILGYDSPEDIFQLGSLERILAPEERFRVRSHVQARQKGQSVPAQQEHRALRKDGARIWLDVRVRQVQWDNASAIQVTIFDITERKQAEGALQQAKDTLEQRVQERTGDLQRVNAQLRTEMAERRQAQEALLQAERLASLGTLATGIAHELNNPLGAITVTAEHARNALSGLDIPEGIRECLDDILKDAHRCAQTVKRTLQFARQGYPMRTVVDLHVIIKNACNLTRGYAKQQDVQLNLTLAPASLPIRANVEEIELALVNLIRNAVEAGQPGAQVHLRTEVEAMQVSITVEDTGAGLTEEEQQYAFDPFYTTRQNAGGTGLGLSITHRIITNHQGTINLCSRPGQGTIVCIRLQLAG